MLYVGSEARSRSTSTSQVRDICLSRKQCRLPEKRLHPPNLPRPDAQIGVPVAVAVLCNRLERTVGRVIERGAWWHSVVVNGDLAQKGPAR